VARPDDPKRLERLARAGVGAAVALGRAAARPAVVFPLVFLALFVSAADATHSIVGGLLGSLPVVALLAGLSIWGRRRVEQQIEASGRSGQLSVQMCLDFACLPGNWPTLARKTLPGGSHALCLPVQITVNDGRLEIDKRRGFGRGRAPFHAEVSTAEITSVTVGPPGAGIMSSSVTIALRSGEELRGDVSLGRERAEELAAQLRALIGGWPGHADSPGIQVTSFPPDVGL
jgi:hypothetical protein